ncbi:tyrosine-type recombinase/integrase [Brevibacterium antiquum]|uniref:Site-specific recombinase XerD n=1 Tax=Brevibacterium antiquum TaxID=234835 RepID=A0A2H1KPQ2_9MICO|nr:tyrosine-type recombinase/integrase [Brevibacterium antiquum]SMY01716.1 Site-specific recombinase XerD [Brevibacterium antiquum]
MLPDHSDLIEQFETTIAAYLSQGTVETRTYYVRRLAQWASAHDNHILSLELKDILTWLSKSIGPSPWTKRSAKSSASVFYKWARRHRYTEHNLADDFPTISAPKGIPNPCPESAVTAALRRCTRIQDVMMLLLGEYQGLRASETAQLHTSDFDPVHDQLRVTGKGNKTRILPLHPIVKEALAHFSPGFLFPSDRNPTGHILGRSLGRRVRHLLGHVPKLNAHSLRHKFGCETLELNPDLLALRDLLGHESVETTQIYARASAQRLQKMVFALPTKPDRMSTLTEIDAGTSARHQ